MLVLLLLMFIDASSTSFFSRACYDCNECKMLNKYVNMVLCFKMFVICVDCVSVMMVCLYRLVVCKL